MLTGICTEIKLTGRMTRRSCDSYRRVQNDMYRLIHDTFVLLKKRVYDRDDAQISIRCCRMLSAVGHLCDGTLKLVNCKENHL